MAVIKCKMCGGDLILTEGQTVAECEYCGSRQTVPTADNEKKLTLFARANRLRAACEFDKAAGVYESIVADFPQEAEAYWGLVLCKYGIEYVDDPATGKKIPTCHRSSFDSVMEDSDLEQALENADAIARKVYREEAKQVEEIRKGIIEVSGKEEPYDIFICYKETDENGERTIDSVIAQDVYDALVGKGYRVFFSRITLEDKLGQEYEPHIFAALNSAKIMLAFGTDYEYYNAVWVKNEWSRYLKLMSSDKSKHLIPCYKGIDAYDMPKEFAKLQAQDMGKVGAMQDLLRGIEKILPKQQPVTVVQERVVVGGSGENKIASLLDRGNMALEDGDWAKADSFFEDVLNNDSKNAQAYIGKALAMEKCRTLDALVRKRKDVSENVKGETLKLQPDQAHIDESVQKYSLPGYVQREKVRQLFAFDRSYHSDVTERKQQYQSEESWWKNHKQLSRAEKFATGAVAENLAAQKKALFNAFTYRVTQAEAAEAAAKKDVQKKYEALLRQADKAAEGLYNDGCARREADYQKWITIAKTSANIGELHDAEKRLNGLNDYADSKQYAALCRKRADEEQAKLDAEAERERQLKEKEDKVKAAKKRKAGIFAAVAVVVAICASLVVTKVVIPANNYKKAEKLYDNGRYVEAAFAFGAIGTYRDAQQRSANFWNTEAVRDTLVAGENDTIAVKTDGTIAIRGYYTLGDDNSDIDKWTDIEAASAGEFHIVGLKSDGIVVAAGSNNYTQCNVSYWKNIVSISAGAVHTVGLKSDGTVVAVGSNTYGQCDVSGWADIVAVSAGGHHTVGLKSDGTVVAVGHNDNAQCDVGDWTGIVAVSAGRSHTVGLKSDGTVVAVGYNDTGACNVSDWTDIVSVSAGEYHTVGLKSDGSVVAVGDNKFGQCDIGGWRDIVSVSAGKDHTVGLKADGTAVAVGNRKNRRCDVADWKDIKLPS